MSYQWTKGERFKVCIGNHFLFWMLNNHDRFDWFQQFHWRISFINNPSFVVVNRQINVKWKKVFLSAQCSSIPIPNSESNDAQKLFKRNLSSVIFYWELSINIRIKELLTTSNDVIHHSILFSMKSSLLPIFLSGTAVELLMPAYSFIHSRPSIFTHKKCCLHISTPTTSNNNVEIMNQD